MSLMTAEEREDLAAEYVLGTLEARDAARVARALATDVDLAASVADWEARLAPLTALYTIDTLLGSFNLQAPPNDGVQVSRGMLGLSLPADVAFDILPDGQGGNTGFVLVGTTLHTINLMTGTPTVLGPVTGLPAMEVIDIAAMR